MLTRKKRKRKKDEPFVRYLGPDFEDGPYLREFRCTGCRKKMVVKIWRNSRGEWRAMIFDEDDAEQFRESRGSPMRRMG